jgi:uncharacterized oxidoreductase
MIEIFCGAIYGGLCARPVPYPKKGNCVFMMLLDPARFGGAEHFRAEVSQLVDYVKSSPRVAGCDEILLPGDPERRLYAQRSKEGITLDDGNWKDLVKAATALGVPVPPIH